MQMFCTILRFALATTLRQYTSATAYPSRSAAKNGSYHRSGSNGNLRNNTNNNHFLLSITCCGRDLDCNKKVSGCIVVGPVLWRFPPGPLGSPEAHPRSPNVPHMVSPTISASLCADDDDADDDDDAANNYGDDDLM